MALNLTVAASASDLDAITVALRAYVTNNSLSQRLSSSGEQPCFSQRGWRTPPCLVIDQLCLLHRGAYDRKIATCRT